jgi:hypothetical protein
MKTISLQKLSMHAPLSNLPELLEKWPTRGKTSWKTLQIVASFWAATLLLHLAPGVTTAVTTNAHSPEHQLLHHRRIGLIEVAGYCKVPCQSCT